MNRQLFIETGFRTGIVFHPNDTALVTAALTRATPVKVETGCITGVDLDASIKVEFVNEAVIRFHQTMAEESEANETPE